MTLKSTVRHTGLWAPLVLLKVWDHHWNSLLIVNSDLKYNELSMEWLLIKHNKFALPLIAHRRKNLRRETGESSLSRVEGELDNLQLSLPGSGCWSRLSAWQGPWPWSSHSSLCIKDVHTSLLSQLSAAERKLAASFPHLSRYCSSSFDHTREGWDHSQGQPVSQKP